MRKPFIILHCAFCVELLEPSSRANSTISVAKCIKQNIYSQVYKRKRWLIMCLPAQHLLDELCKRCSSFRFISIVQEVQPPYVNIIHVSSVLEDMKEIPSKEGGRFLPHSFDCVFIYVYDLCIIMP